MTEAERIISQSEEIVTEAEVCRALDQLAEQLNHDLADKNPVVLAVMNGAIIPAGHILTRLKFPLLLGYLHATRYDGKTTGGELVWKMKPSVDVENQVVLLIDDIFDEGNTLKAIEEAVLELGAKEVYTATLVNKVHDRKPKNYKVDYVGFDVPDRYVFGCGMDCHNYWRNLPSIWALK